MDTRSLEQAFIAVFHKKASFSDFCSFNPSHEIEEFFVKERQVFRPTDKFKGYLRFLDNVVVRHLTQNDGIVHSYIREKSALSAIQAHAGNHSFFSSDIEAFFPSIRAEDVQAVFERDREHIPISDIDHHLERIIELTTWGGSLPVGFPTSPKISNSFLLEFDNALAKYCNNNELTYTRYSDDIIISSKKKSPLDNVREIVQQFLNIHANPKLKLNPNKTSLTHTGNKVKLLGLIITPEGHVTIDAKHKKTIETLLHFYRHDREKYFDLLEKKYNGREQSLFGLLHYANSCDPGYIEKLQRKYGTLALHSLMENRWHENR